MSTYTQYVGEVSWGIVPLSYSSYNVASMSAGSRANNLKSANDTFRYQVQYKSSNLKEDQEVGNEGQILNVFFDVFTSTRLENNTFEKIATIKKSRDIANRPVDPAVPSAGLHRFTVDIGQLLSDQLSYSLCPLNSGTWKSHAYGGLNGGKTMQDNVIGFNSAAGSAVSFYNVSLNGSFRYVRVEARFEIFDANLNLVMAQDSSGNEQKINSPLQVTAINSVNQFEKDAVYYEGEFVISRYAPTSDDPRRFLTRCPNFYYSDSSNNTVAYNKPIRMDDDAEYLQWYLLELFDNANDNQFYNYAELYGVSYNTDGTTNDFILQDFNSLLSTDGANIVTEFGHDQSKMLVQNVSPEFINSNAFAPQTGAGRPYLNPVSPITSITDRYSLHFRGRYYNDNASPPAYVTKIHSATNWFRIDRESENIPYGFVRFHWLNSMGGIDSFTCKRDVIEGLSVNRSVVERKSADRTWIQDDNYIVNGSPFSVESDKYISDTMRGGNLYKGGREVTSVSADRVQSVYTEPLNKVVAKWLEEILISPNVWVQMRTPATERNKEVNSFLHRSQSGYIPVIITNSDIETVNQEKGLVTFNLEYILSHKVQTQRN